MPDASRLPSREEIQRSEIFGGAYATALAILSESTEFTQAQQEILARAMAHAAIHLAMDWQLQVSNVAMSEALSRSAHLSPPAETAGEDTPAQSP